MHDWSDLLLPEHVLKDLAAPTKKALFTQVAALAAPAFALDAARVADALAERERLGSTGFGGGVAIPHAKVAGLPRIAALVARLAQPIDFAAIDDAPVDLAVVLLSPPDAGAEHLKALARVSRRLRDEAFVAKLRGAGSRDAMWALLTADDARDAA
jgi:nitrogen PTS system EIIA component